MRFTCQQSDLSTAINTVQKAISSKSTLPILKGILLEASEGKLKLTGNDLNIGIETWIEADVATSGSIVISSKIFGEIIRKLPSTSVDITISEDNNVQIYCEKSEFNILGQPSVEYPELPEVLDENSYTLECDLLRNMIRQTIFATSQDESRPVLTGSLVEIHNNMISMVAIDGYRLAMRKAHLQTETENRAVIPGKTLNEVGKILASFEGNETVHIAFTEKHILFTVDNIKVISRLLEGEFIKYNQIIPQEFKTKLTVNTSDLLNAIERASLLAREGKNSSIKLTVRDGQINITSNAEIGSVNEEVQVGFEGNELEIGFNPRYLVEALKVMDSDELIMELTTSVSPCIMKPIDHDNYIYLVLPVRMAS